MENDIKSRIIEGMKMDDDNVICKFPKNMLLEPTNICNDSCLFCANSKCTKERGMINKCLAKKILKEAYNLGTREVGFYGTGEPLVDNNLEEYIKYAKELGYEYVYITTNGALLSKERTQSIAGAGIDSVKFSINASDAKGYYFIHGKDEFDQIIENLIYFDMFRKKYNRKIALYISFVSTRYTYIDKEKFMKKYQKYVDDIVFDDSRNIAGCMANEIKKYLSVDHNMGYHPQNGICPIIFKNLYITYEGYLTMCCADFQNYLVVADLNKESLKDAWNNQYAQELRRRHLNHNLDGTLCFNCINDCIESIKPLRQEYGVIFDSSSWDKSAEVEERIRRHNL